MMTQPQHYDLDFTAPLNLEDARQALNDIAGGSVYLINISVSFSPQGDGWSFHIKKRGRRRIAVSLDGSLDAADTHSTHVTGKINHEPIDKYTLRLSYLSILASLVFALVGVLDIGLPIKPAASLIAGLAVSLTLGFYVLTYWSDKQSLLMKIYHTLNQSTLH